MDTMQYQMMMIILMLIALLLGFTAFSFFVKSRRQELDRYYTVDVITSLQNRLERKSTGRRDKNGVAIKLNDYISFSYAGGEPTIARVDWDRYDCAFKAVIVKSGADADQGNILSFGELPKSGLEVIGNTFDNLDIEDE